jgi:hypothetical protein
MIYAAPKKINPNVAPVFGSGLLKEGIFQARVKSCSIAASNLPTLGPN